MRGNNRQLPGPGRREVSERQLLDHRLEVGVHHRRHADLTDGDVRVLQAMAGQDAHHRGAGPRPSGSPNLRRPATEAAEAGSQNTDSSAARNR